MLHSVTAYKKKVGAIFRKKVTNGVFTQRLLEGIITKHSEALQE